MISVSTPLLGSPFFASSSVTVSVQTAALPPSDSSALLRQFGHRSYLAGAAHARGDSRCRCRVRRHAHASSQRGSAAFGARRS
eukprot:scaffold2367_cov376-Prasinococcus_capsulatus_cf.AAC.4